MTEEEARTKWCPMVRLAWQVNPDRPHDAITANRWGSGQPIDVATCIGSACMMWRWEHKQHERWEDSEGYCGLADKP